MAGRLDLLDKDTDWRLVDKRFLDELYAEIAELREQLATFDREEEDRCCEFCGEDHSRPRSRRAVSGPTS